LFRYLQNDFYSFVSGSAQPQLPIKDLNEIEINLPPLHEQKAIAEVLSSLDDKIDLLHRQNKTLEAMAEALFRQWFVEAMEDEWKIGTINQLVFIQNGFAFKSSDFKECGISGVIKIKNISEGIINIENTDFIKEYVVKKTDERFRIKAGDVLIAMTGAEIGKLGIIPNTDKSLWLNQRVGLLKEKFRGAKYLAYLCLKSELGQDHIENTATGSAQPNISATGIESCEFPIMNHFFLENCALQIEELYNMVIFNLGQIRTLSQLRDTLLPKLMSGEVRVAG
jgi:type I restriction enzyme S subunit